MIDFKAGEIILIPFPFTDLSTHKQRPAVILSSTKFNHGEDIIIAAITSHITGKAGRYEYLFTPRELESAGLPRPSVVKVGKIVTLHRELVRKQLGKVSPKTRQKIIDLLREIIVGY
jgi:mRNA interferase MazF